MISEKLLQRYHINLSDYIDDEIGLYFTFLCQTDYIANKIVEAQFLGTSIEENYTEVLQARQYARKHL